MRVKLSSEDKISNDEKKGPKRVKTLRNNKIKENKPAMRNYNLWTKANRKNKERVFQRRSRMK